MIRPVLIELGLFLTPFALYAVFLAAARGGVLDVSAWSPRVLIWLTIAALVLMGGSFLLLAHFSGAPAGTEYVPPHMDGGRLVPGQFR
jgi:hypothetical protein